MKKMPCLFVRTFGEGRNDFALTETVTPGCEWVFDDDPETAVTASRKWDGTACFVMGGVLHARFDRKLDRKGIRKAAPEGWIQCDPEPDPATGHWPGWVPVHEQPQYKHHAAAWGAVTERISVIMSLSRNTFDADLEGCTLELCGPGVNGNHDGLLRLALYVHGDALLTVPRTFSGLRDYLEHSQIEGIVFAHTDGRRAKLRRNDFGFAWPLPPPVEQGDSK